MALKKNLLFVNEPSVLYYANLVSDKDIVVNQGGTSSGKSYSIMQVLITMAISNRNWTITVVGGTIPKLKEDVMRITAEIVSMNPNVGRFVKSFNIADRIYTFTTGSLIEFKSFEDSEQAKGSKRQVLYISEATRISYDIFFEAYYRTTTKTFIDFNPTAKFWV